jgi:hypothetical protein
MPRVAILSVAFSLLLLVAAVTQTSAQAAGPRAFTSADEAANAFIAAAEKFDEAALTEILGPGSYDLIHSGDPVADRDIAMEFGRMGREKYTLVTDKRNRNLVMLSVGSDDWPSPIPIVRKAGKWYLDAAAGRQELLFRRVGRNELDAIQMCRGFVEAQNEYAASKHDGAPVNQYAQKLIATPGKQDGLAWQNADGTWAGPVGENVAKAIAKGYADRTAPYRGYYYKLLRGQGPSAPLGAMNYMVKDYMIAGYAMVAFPALYKVTGVKTFIVSNDGVVFEKDLGPNTLEIASKMELFDPDRTWAPVFVDEQPQN